MTATKKEILSTIGDAIEKMDGNQLSYMIGFGEGLAMNKGLGSDKAEAEETKNEPGNGSDSAGNSSTGSD